MNKRILELIKRFKIRFWILLFIMAIGIFLRVYHFRDWLYFYPDQARDATIVEKVISGESDWPLMGPIAASTRFRIGPIYYYFQIISAEIFGTGPEKMAYPDLFFSLLSIPLFYYFLSRYFNRNLSLALTGLYSVSFYAIEYSRFAWNPNPIPFFILLFLISLWKLLLDKEKTGWLWIILIGVTLGVNVQLHTLLLMLLPTMLFFIFAYLLWKHGLAWKKWVVIFVLAILLNIPQLISETRNNYQNSKVFLKIFSNSSNNGQKNFEQNLKLGLFGYSQANAHILSSLGDKLNFDFLSITSQKIRYKIKYGTPIFPLDCLMLLGIFSSVLFFLFGCWALGHYCKNEKNEQKKYFLGLIILYSFLSFLIMLPIMYSLSLRYFIHLVFVPFFFLGFLINFVKNKYPRAYLPVTVAIFCFLIVANFITIGSEAKAHRLKNRSNNKYVVLGEIEEMRDYMISLSFGNSVNLFVQKRYMQNYIKPFTYVFSQKGFSLIRTKKLNKISDGKSVFTIWRSSNRDPKYLQKYDIETYRNFGQIGIYKLKN